MVTPAKDLDLATLRPRFSTVVSTLGGWLSVLRRSPTRHADPALGAEQAMIRPSPHERVAIEAHREDRL
jgi:hypothetical protein